MEALTGKRISAVGGAVGGTTSTVLFEVINFLVSFAVLSVLFAAMFKVLPDAQIAWHDVWVGGAVTALLFVIGTFVIGLYLGHSKPGDAFGAASALALILVWAYYSGMIIFLGAEFTQEWAGRQGRVPAPEAGAVHATPVVVGDSGLNSIENAITFCLRPWRPCQPLSLVERSARWARLA